VSNYNWKFDDDGLKEGESENLNQYSVEYEPGVYGFITDEGSSGFEWMAQFQDHEWGSDRETKIKGYNEAVKLVDAAYEQYKNSK
jgi:hypothetical protein